MNFQDLDPQAKWEMTALNALELAAQTNARLATMILAADSMKQPLDLEELIQVIRDTQARLCRDLKIMRRLTDQREREQR